MIVGIALRPEFSDTCARSSCEFDQKALFLVRFDQD